MSVIDGIQLANLVVIAITLVVLVWQTTIQNRLSKAQMMRDRLETYWRLYEPVSDGQLQIFHLNHHDYVDDGLYESTYKANDAAVRQYIALSQNYEYLGYLTALKTLGVPDLMGANILEIWTKDLVAIPTFMHVHQHFQKYYPKFAEIIERCAASSKA